MGVRALTTTRAGGVSRSPYDSLNLGDHVGDAPEAVAKNRDLLASELGLPSAPAWLKQVHGIEVVEAMPGCTVPTADAAFTDQAGVVCAVMTADCLPVLLCDLDGRVVAAAHAGWRGLADGVIEATVARMAVEPGRLLAWLGPAIGPDAFEVGDEVRDTFIAYDPVAEKAFRRSPKGRWLADIYLLARQRLSALGVTRVYGGDFCTYQDEQRFFSYRRDGVTGRMASLIWLEKPI